MGSMPPASIVWRTPGLEVVFSVSPDVAPSIETLLPRHATQPPSVSPFFDAASVPLDGVRVAGEGNTSIKTSKALIGSYTSLRLRYEFHVQQQHGSKYLLDIVSIDPDRGLRITHHFEAYGHVPVLRSYATITNTSSVPIPITQLSSLNVGNLTVGTHKWWKEYSIAICRNTWFREAMWQKQTLEQAGVDDCYLFGLKDGHRASQATYSLSNRGSFSTGTYLPMGALSRRDAADVWLWQVESSGSWKWEIGDFQDSVYLAAGGPTLHEHDWQLKLMPGATFTSVPVACAHVQGPFDMAVAALTDYRRQIIRPHLDYEKLPIIFNDYMNCLMGDPTEDKIKALLDVVVHSGAEYFVIDAGWYADDSNWWDDVGLWEPSRKRFPSGFKLLLDTIRQKGLIPGVWIEPEVIGVKSVVGKQLPEEAFFQQAGQRVVERGRWQLDYRCVAVQERMRGVIHKLVTEYGVGYFKFDYNIEVLSGSDWSSESTGVAHLDHQRAYLTWAKDLLDAYPGLVIENCSSGAQRMDYNMLSTHTIQSTSDQQDPVAYAAIAAAIPSAVLPEQGATWAYPQGEWSDEINALTVTNSLLGRIHLSGRLDHLQPHQLNLVKTGMDVYKSIRHRLKTAHPFWPLGMPTWHADWLALGMKCADGSLLLSVWRRGGDETVSILLPSSSSTSAYQQATLLYPLGFETKIELRQSNLEIGLPNTVCARLFHIH